MFFKKKKGKKEKSGKRKEKNLLIILVSKQRHLWITFLLFPFFKVFVKEQKSISKGWSKKREKCFLKKDTEIWWKSEENSIRKLWGRG